MPRRKTTRATTRRKVLTPDIIYIPVPTPMMPAQPQGQSQGPQQPFMQAPGPVRGRKRRGVGQNAPQNAMQPYQQNALQPYQQPYQTMPQTMMPGGQSMMPSGPQVGPQTPSQFPAPAQPIHEGTHEETSPFSGLDLGKFLGDAVGRGLRQGFQSSITQIATAIQSKIVASIAGIAGGVNPMGGLSGIGSVGEQWPAWLEEALNSEYLSVFVVGRRNSGKTTFAAGPLAAKWQQKHGGYPIFWVGPSANIPLPPNMIAVPHHLLGPLMQQVPAGCAVILDDASLYINSKRSMSQLGLTFEELQNTVAHRGILLVCTVQDSSDINKAGIRSDIIFLKPPDPMFEVTERRKMLYTLRQAKAAFDAIPREERVKYIYGFMDSEHQGMIKYERPAWMTHEIAKYRRIGGAYRGQGAQGAYVLPGMGANQPALPSPVPTLGTIGPMTSRQAETQRPARGHRDMSRYIPRGGTLGALSNDLNRAYASVRAEEEAVMSGSQFGGEQPAQAEAQSVVVPNIPGLQAPRHRAQSDGPGDLPLSFGG